MSSFKINNHMLEIESYHSVIIGSGAAGLNCALHLYEEGIPANEIAIITEKLGAGTSFNTGSDKQTYYKMSIIGDKKDNPYKMAQDYISGGAMHGDIALIETNNSLREFFHLVHLGVPFPHDKYGAYVGYKTDNDPRQRATSIGPLTSQTMCECLLGAIGETRIKVLDNNYAIDLIIDNEGTKNRVIGVITIKLEELTNEKDLSNLINSMKIVLANNIILATGGPAAMYKYSVYPLSQWGSMSLAIDAGCVLQNLTESQFGLASTKFRWNLSGSYQQVIPRYFSLDDKKEEREFLEDYFPSFNQLSEAIFLKGYQWPFNSDRIEEYGSSLIDVAVFYEIEVLKNQVFLDYRKNPKSFDKTEMNKEAKMYLEKSNALANTPIERLEKLNPAAINLYKEHNIDLRKEPLEIALCNQHLNGGVKGDIWWETNIEGIFAIGEVNGSHGIHRPGGAALNSGQVGGLRTAQKIVHTDNKMNMTDSNKIIKLIEKYLQSRIDEFKWVLANKNAEKTTPKQIIKQIKIRMAKYGSIRRPLKGLADEIENIEDQIQNVSINIGIEKNREILSYLRMKDLLKTQLLFLNAFLNYHNKYGRSRGSFLILRDNLEKCYGEKIILPHDNLKEVQFLTSKKTLKKKIQTIQYLDGEVKIVWEKVRPIPTDFGWFENTLKEYKEEKIFK